MSKLEPLRHTAGPGRLGLRLSAAQALWEGWGGGEERGEVGGGGGGGGRKGPESDLVLHLQRVSGEFRIMICPCSGSADEELTNNISICPETLRNQKLNSSQSDSPT